MWSCAVFHSDFLSFNDHPASLGSSSLYSSFSGTATLSFNNKKATDYIKNTLRHTKTHLPTMSAANNTATAFVCQESFQANNVTSCLRYTKLKKCVKDGQANHLNYLCVDANSIAVGGTVTPPPANLTLTPFMCTLASCPNAAPDDNSTKSGSGGGGKKNGTSTTSAGTRGTISEKTWSLSGALVLALLVSQMVLF